MAIILKIFFSKDINIQNNFIISIYMKKIFLMAVMAMMVSLGMQAQGPARVPAYRGLIERVQPNGDTLRTYLRGDERAHYVMTEDGWQIQEDKKGWLKYMQKNRKGEVVISRKKAHNTENRSKCEEKWLKKHGINKTVVEFGR